MAKLQVTGLWTKESKKKDVFLSGVLNKEKVEELIALIEGEDQIFVNVFANSYKKKGDKKPEWILYFSTPDKDLVPTRTEEEYEPTKSQLSMRSRVAEVKEETEETDDLF